MGILYRNDLFYIIILLRTVGLMGNSPTKFYQVLNKKEFNLLRKNVQDFYISQEYTRSKIDL